MSANVNPMPAAVALAARMMAANGGWGDEPKAETPKKIGCEVIQYPDDRLRQISLSVGRDELPGVVGLARDLNNTLARYPVGVAISAPQIGVHKRVFVVRHPKAPVNTFINPVIHATASLEITMVEGCLSLPGVSEGITRPDSVLMSFTGIDGRHHRCTVSGLFARIVQHEIDHLDGILFFDRLPRNARRRFERKHGGDQNV